MSNTSILLTSLRVWFYPCVLRRIRRVDAKYAYLVVKDGYVPLLAEPRQGRRREGVLRAFLPYVKYGKWLDGHETHYFITLILDTIDELSNFFQTRMLNEEYSELAPKEKYRSSVTFEEECDVSKKLKNEREKLSSLYYHY